MNPPQTRAQKNLRFALRVLGLLARGFAVVVSLLLIAVAGLYVALPKIVDGNRAKVMLETQLSQVLRRPVDIQNVILTPQGVKLTQVKVFRPDHSAAFIEAEFALVTVRLPALLNKRLELSNVRLVSPRISVFRDEQGVWSFADIFASTAAARATPPKPFELPVSLAADQTAIEHGSLTVDDRLRGRRYTIDKFNLAVKQFSLDAPFAYSLSFENQNTFGERQVATSLAAEGECSLAGFDWPQAYVNAAKAEAALDGRVVKGSFAATGFPLPAVEAELLLPALGPDDWQYWLKKDIDLHLPPSRAQVKGKWLEARKAAVDDLRVKAGPLAARASGTLDWTTPDKPQVEAAISAEEFPLDQAAGFRAALERFGLRGAAAGEAEVSGWHGRWKIAKAHVRARDVEARMRHWRVVRGDADITATDDFAKLAVSLSSGTLEAYKNTFSDIALSLKLVKSDLKVDYLGLKWEDARLRVRGRVVNLPEPRDVWISGTLDHLHWERAQQLLGDIIASVSTHTAVAQPAKSQYEDDDESAKRLWVQTFKYALPKRFPDTMGHIKIAKVLHKNFSFDDMDLLWDLHRVTNKLDSVNGEIRAAFGPGRVNDIEAVSSSHKFLRIVFLPYIYMHKMNSLSVLSLETAYPKTLDFDRIEGQYGVSRGVIDTRFSEVRSPQLMAYADGLADFGRETVNMNILTRLTSYRAPLPEWWVDEKGRPAIGFRVKGDLNHPELEPRLHKIGATELETAMDEGRRRASARFEALDKLRQLEGAPAPKPPETVADKDTKKGAKK